MEGQNYCINTLHNKNKIKFDIEFFCKIDHSKDYKKCLCSIYETKIVVS